MKRIFLILAIFLTAVLFPIQMQAQTEEIFKQEGIASWYGKEFDGRPTASGEIFDSSKFTAAHPRLPFGTMLVVTNTHNNKKITVRINDRGPFVAARIIDVSRAAAEQLDMIITGTAPVKIESINKIAMPQPAVEIAQNSNNTVPVVNNANNYNPANNAANNASNILKYSQPDVQVSENQYQQPVLSQPTIAIRLIPDIEIVQSKRYRLQVGSYNVPKNAIDAFDKLKNVGLSPNYEQFIDNNNKEYFRVVLSGISGADMQFITEKIKTAGFKEAVIRIEN